MVHSFIEDSLAIQRENQSWQLIQVLNEATVYLKNQGIEHPRLNAERLLAKVLKLSRIELYLQFEKPLQMKERKAYKSLLRRRAGHEPLQYILGEIEFMSLPFLVEPHVLIPRPETELLVEKVLEITGTGLKNKPIMNILDIGTGNGCIAVSLANALPFARLLAIDNNQTALALAEKNARLNGVTEQIRFIKMDIMKDAFKIENKFDVIVSNPPYIQEKDLITLSREIHDYEPISALNGGSDGLLYYRRFSEILPPQLNSRGVILLEMGADQATSVKKLFNIHPWLSIQIHKDLAGLDRAIILKQ